MVGNRTWKLGRARARRSAVLLIIIVLALAASVMLARTSSADPVPTSPKTKLPTTTPLDAKPGLDWLASQLTPLLTVACALVIVATFFSAFVNGVRYLWPTTSVEEKAQAKEHMKSSAKWLAWSLLAGTGVQVACLLFRIKVPVAGWF